MGKESNKASTLKPEQKAVVLRSVAQYLERCGFSKCLKKLLSEAEIEKKELNSSLPGLEEVFCDFFNKSPVEESGDDSEDGKKKKAASVDENASVDHEKDEKEEGAEVSAMEGVEKEKKDKKKKKKKEPELEVTKEEEEEEKKGVAEVSAPEGVEDVKKEKKKKKKKEPKVEEEEKVKGADAEVEDGEKEKKKKKKKTKSESSEAAESLVDDDGKEKSSKKRKRSEPEETKEQTTEEDGVEESKRRKKEDNAVEETPVKQQAADVLENGNVEKSGKKSGKGLSNSKEPKVPFQRVKVEDVVFTDERLKDNSYWAKDGADSGYGAKAQEVLGQVRGRGFRHEKTKKKRGSYRGGEIDLQSHSVKFEYSDDE